MKQSKKFYCEPEFIAYYKEVCKHIEKTTGKSGFVNPLPLLLKMTLYIIIFGQRSNGKTFCALLIALIRYFMYGELFCIVRRWDEDFKPKSTNQLFGAFKKYKLIEFLSGGEWSHIVCKSKMFYLARYDEDGNEIVNKEPICYGFALTQMEHDKGGTYPPNITTIVFDEFLTRGMYLPAEMTLFENVISTVIRDDGQCKIWMLGNTVSKYCPYFREMGLRHIKDMQIGDIHDYQGTSPECTITVYYSDGLPNGKATDKYFAFDNPSLKMITEGRFETAVYPHLPLEYTIENVMFVFFILFDDNLLKGEVINVDDSEFIFFTPKTTPLKYEDDELIFSDLNDPRPNWRRRLTRPVTHAERAIFALFRSEKVFYLDNECGEVVRTYLQWCESERVV